MPQTENIYIQEFLNYLSFQKRYSKNTLISYLNDLTAFFDFVQSAYQLSESSEITTPMVRTWLASLKEKKATARTINRKISSLRSFYKFQLRVGKITMNPVDSITSLKVSRRLPSFIEEKEISRLFENDFFPPTLEGMTSRLVIMILYQTGIRRNELIHLKESHIDRQAGTIKVLGKGNKERILPVRNQLLLEIDDYISEKRKQFGDLPGQTLLVNRKGGLPDPKYIYNIVKNSLALVSTSERKSPHVLRHSFATHLTNNGAEINAIKELLGHSSLAATQIYTHNTIKKLKEVHKQAHPRS